VSFQIRLWLILSIFGLSIWVCAYAFLPRLLLTDYEEATVRQVAVLYVGAIAIVGFAYLISVSLGRRLLHLTERARAACLHPKQQRVDLPGPNDELTVLADTINELAERLTQGEEVRNQLVMDVAHELRTPVAIIRGHLETMLKGAEELKPENLLLLLDETKRMSRLIQEMRDLNLAESGRLQLDRMWVAFGELVGEIVSIMESEAELKGISLRLCGDWEGEVYCDVPRVKQVLVNLIGNAIRYVPEGGKVEVSYRYDEGNVRIQISDNGEGIAPEHLPYLFKRFYRVEASRNRQSGGTGLGLAIAKEFIEAHGGDVEVSSQVGEGTTFEIALPVYPLSP
jgi:two-component system, OmpR family, sensor histidine kinase BaeS